MEVAVAMVALVVVDHSHILVPYHMVAHHICHHTEVFHKNHIWVVGQEGLVVVGNFYHSNQGGHTWDQEGVRCHNGDHSDVEVA